LRRILSIDVTPATSAGTISRKSSRRRVAISNFQIFAGNLLRDGCRETSVGTPLNGKLVRFEPAIGDGGPPSVGRGHSCLLRRRERRTGVRRDGIPERRRNEPGGTERAGRSALDRGDVGARGLVRCSVLEEDPLSIRKEVAHGAPRDPFEFELLRRTGTVGRSTRVGGVPGATASTCRPSGESAWPLPSPIRVAARPGSRGCRWSRSSRLPLPAR